MIAQTENINELVTALAKAQATIKNPSLNRVNKGFNSKYADLASILNAALPALSAQGIAVLQIPRLVEDGVVLHTRLTHTSGQWIESTYPVAPLDTHQKMGAGLTYAKRQALSSMIGVAGEDDMDGEDSKDMSTSKMTKQKEELSEQEAFRMYESLLEEMSMKRSEKDLKEWGATSGNLISLLPKNLQTDIRRDYAEHMSQIKGGKNVAKSDNETAGA